MKREKDDATKPALHAPFLEEFRVALVVIHMVKMQQCRASCRGCQHGCPGRCLCAHRRCACVMFAATRALSDTFLARVTVVVVRASLQPAVGVNNAPCNGQTEISQSVQIVLDTLFNVESGGVIRF